jgi:hypothetical protein
LLFYILLRFNDLLKQKLDVEDELQEKEKLIKSLQGIIEDLKKKL